jgi:hypothetical protein
MKEPLSRGLWGVLATPFTADAARVDTDSPSAWSRSGYSERAPGCPPTSARKLPVPSARQHRESPS